MSRKWLKNICIFFYQSNVPDDDEKTLSKEEELVKADSLSPGLGKRENEAFFFFLGVSIFNVLGKKFKGPLYP